MTAILLIAFDSVRAFLHQRLLVVLMLVTLGLTVLFSVLLTEAKEWIPQTFENASAAREGVDEETIENMHKGTRLAGAFFVAGFYWFSALGGTVVALFICSFAVATDIRNGTIQITLSKPVSRLQFVLGKYCGAIAVIIGYSILSGIALVIFAYSNQLDLNLAARYAPWLMFCHNLMVGSVALCLSLLIHPLIAAVVAYFASASFLSPPNPLYFILPSYDRFNVFTLIIGGRFVPLEEIFILTLYAFDVAAIFLLLAVWRFRTKELL